MGEQIAASSPSLGSRRSWGPPHLPHQHGTQLGVPRAMIPKTKRGWEPRRAQTPEIDTLTPLPTDTPQREATPTNTRSLCAETENWQTRNYPAPPATSAPLPHPLSFPFFPLRLSSITEPSLNCPKLANCPREAKGFYWHQEHLSSRSRDDKGRLRSPPWVATDSFSKAVPLCIRRPTPSQVGCLLQWTEHQ